MFVQLKENYMEYLKNVREKEDNVNIYFVLLKMENIILLLLKKKKSKKKYLKNIIKK